MILNKNNCNRLIIYFFYDKDGIVDEYVLYMLEALKGVSSEIVVVSNGQLEEKSREKINDLGPYLIERENEGFDVWAYKTAIDKYGWNKIAAFDEVVMMNFTIMGPVYPLDEMFDSMNARDLDFWGITMFHKYEKGDPFGTIDVGYIPDHIQSHFIAVRNNMLVSEPFHDYWDNMGAINDYRDAVGRHEAIFTKIFSEKGFLWDVYADMGDGYNNHPILCATREMLENKRCPIFKRRSFMQDYNNILNDTIGQSAIETIDYIRNNTSYDVDMIWQNILRLENQADIKKNLQLNYVLSTKSTNFDDNIINGKKVALVMHCYFDDLIEYCLSYAKSMPKSADIFITVPSEKNKVEVERIFSELENNVKVIVIQNRGRDVSALLVATKSFIMEYDYVCFMHDKKVTQLKPETIGYGFSYKCFENLLGSKNLVKNIIQVFEENPRLGMLTPPPPNHGDYYITLGLEWGMNFENTKDLADRLGVKVPIDEKKEPIAPLGTMFWFRPRAMKLLFDQDWEYEDFPKEPNNIDGTLLHAVERIYSYVVQQEGYYPAWIFSDKGADIEITNLNHMLRTMNEVVFHEGPGAGRFEDVINGLHCEFGYAGHKKVKMGLNASSIYINSGKGFNESEKASIENDITGSDDIRFYHEINCPCREIRWDPGEGPNVTLSDLVISVKFLDGKIKQYRIYDTKINGIMINARCVFLTDDPQVIISFAKKREVVSVEIVGKAWRELKKEDLKFINKRAVPLSQKIKMLIYKIFYKLSVRKG